MSTPEAQFERVLQELAELMLDLGDLSQRVVLIGGQVLALLLRAQGANGQISITTETGVVVERGFSFEPDLLFDIEDDFFQSQRLVEVLHAREWRRGRFNKWLKELEPGGAQLELDLFAPEDADPDALPTQMQRLPHSAVATRRASQLTVTAGGVPLRIAVPDPCGYLRLKLDARLQHRVKPKDCFDIYVFLKVTGTARARESLDSAGRDGEQVRTDLRNLFGSDAAPGVLDVLAYADRLSREEKMLLAQDVVDSVAEVLAADG